MSRLDYDSFAEHGFLEIPDFVSQEQCLALRQRALEIVEETDLSAISSVFSTTHQTHTQDEYFTESARQVKCFLEHDAVDEDGQLAEIPAEGAVNKIGHAQHDLDDTFKSFSYTADIAGIAKDLGYLIPWLIQAMYVFKAPQTGGEVVAHTDHPFLWTEPSSVIGFWFAIDDATEENGCLWVQPGGHLSEPIRSRFKRNEQGTTTEILDDTPFDDTKFIPMPAKCGTLILLDGKLPHKSAHNHSDKSRHAYTLHLIEGDQSRATYPKDNWLQQTPELPFRNLYETVGSAK